MRFESAAAVISRSPISLDVPITLVGFTALSVEVKITRATPLAMAASITFWVPSILVRTAWVGLSSQSGTCLSAAACRTVSIPCMRSFSPSMSRMSPR